MHNRIPWLRITAEGAAIVVSILLAFGIQAWWEGRGDESDVSTSLELLAADLVTLQQALDQFERLMEDQRRRAASASEALAGPVHLVDRSAVSQNLAELIMRRTVDLSSAAFTDLTSTGTIGLIEDRALRSRILEFYHEAARTQAVLEKNNTLFKDDLVTRLLYGEGLLLTLPGGAPQDDPLWELGPDSPEWRRLRSALGVYEMVGGFNLSNARLLNERAADLREAIDRHLGR